MGVEPGNAAGTASTRSTQLVTVPAPVPIFLTDHLMVADAGLPITTVDGTVTEVTARSG